MLDLLDAGLESYLRSAVPLGATDVDVSFEAPTRDFAAKLNRPTVNIFLWDIRRSATRSRSGVKTVVGPDGARGYAHANPIIELRYVVTAWTADHGDERSLLSGLMRSVMLTEEIPRTHLSPTLAHLDTPRVMIARSGEDHIDVFRAVDGQLKPGLNVQIIAEFDAGMVVPAGPPVVAIDTKIARLNGDASEVLARRVAGEVADAQERGAVGVVVSSPNDAAVVGEDGRFLIRAQEGDELTLNTEPAQTMVVPAAGGVRFE